MIEVELSKKLKNFQIDVHFVFKGIRNVLFGASGSGKSSILKMITGFFEPDSGFVRVGNQVFYDSNNKINQPIYKRDVGYIPQEYTLFPHMSVLDNILYGIKARGLKLDEGRFSYLIEKTNLGDYLNAFPHEISGGQRQRVSLVRALIVEPKILLLDEPFSALDRPLREELREVVVDLVEEMNIPTIFVSHDIDEAYDFAEEIAVIDNGKIIQAEYKQTVFSSPETVKVARLLGFRNIFSIDSFENGDVVVSGFRFKSDKIEPYHRFCFIRPEDVLILREDRDSSDKENVIFATVEAMYEHSDSVLIKTKDGDLEVLTKVSKHVVDKMSIKQGKKVILSLKKDRLVGGR